LTSLLGFGQADTSIATRKPAVNNIDIHRIATALPRICRPSIPFAEVRSSCVVAAAVALLLSLAADFATFPASCDSPLRPLSACTQPVASSACTLNYVR
jgi:hypothetical protein